MRTPHQSDGQERRRGGPRRERPWPPRHGEHFPPDPPGGFEPPDLDEPSSPGRPFERFGPPGRRRGRGPGRGRRGDVRNAVLALLADEPMNGYQLIAAITERSQGLWQPGAGSIYPALGLLHDEGLIEPVDRDGKKVYQLTADGEQYVSEHAAELDAPWDRVSAPHQGYLDVRAEVHQLGLALHQVVLAGDTGQIEAAKAVLEQTRRDLYRVLAGDTRA